MTHDANGFALAEPAWMRLARRFALVASVIFIAYFAVRVGRNIPESLRCDWGVYYHAGEAMRQRAPIYTLQWGPDMTFKNAPCVALLMAPFSLLPPVPARVLWFLADAALLAVMVWLATSLLWPDGRRADALSWPAILAVLLTFKFLIDQWHAGQSTTLFLTLTVAAFYWMERGRMGAAGAALAATVCLKLVPICFVPYFLLRPRGWVGLLSFAASMVALLALPAAWIGWEANLDLLAQWPRHLSATDIPVQAWRAHNQSVYAALARLLTPTDYHVEIAALTLRQVRMLWLALSSAAAAGLYLFLWRTRRDPSPRRAGTHLALLLLFMTLFNPLAWAYNFVALLPVFLLLIDSLRRPAGHALGAILFAVGFLMVSVEIGVKWLPLLDLLHIWNIRCLGGLVLTAAVGWSWLAARRTAAHHSWPVSECVPGGLAAIPERIHACPDY